MFNRDRMMVVWWSKYVAQKQDRQTVREVESVVKTCV